MYPAIDQHARLQTISNATSLGVALHCQSFTFKTGQTHLESVPLYYFDAQSLSHRFDESRRLNSVAITRRCVGGLLAARLGELRHRAGRQSRA